MKELLDRYNIKPSLVIRRALEEEVKRRVLEELEELYKELPKELSQLSDEEVVSLYGRIGKVGSSVSLRREGITIYDASNIPQSLI